MTDENKKLVHILFSMPLKKDTDKFIYRVS